MRIIGLFPCLHFRCSRCGLSFFSSPPLCRLWPWRASCRCLPAIFLALLLPVSLGGVFIVLLVLWFFPPSSLISAPSSCCVYYDGWFRVGPSMISSSLCPFSALPIGRICFCSCSVICLSSRYAPSIFWLECSSCSPTLLHQPFFSFAPSSLPM